MKSLPWFEARPHDLKKEIKALNAMGVGFTIDPAAQQLGIIQIELTIDNANKAFNLSGITEPLKLTAIFPDNYPFFRPEVYAQNLSLPRHQNPFGKNLCLLPRSTAAWDVDLTLVAYLQSQLPKVIEKGNIIDPALIAADPDEQAEPLSEYVADPWNPIIFDGSWTNKAEVAEQGILFLGKARIGIPDKAGLPTRMAVLETVTPEKEIVGVLPFALKSIFPHRFDGILLQLEKFSPTGNALTDFDQIIKDAEEEGIFGIKRKPLPLKNGAVLNGIVGLNFPEEAAGHADNGMGWLFIVSLSVERTRYQGKKLIKFNERHAYYAKASRAGDDDLQIRVPRLLGLKNRCVALVGLGAIGAPAALELARNQVGELKVMDFDVVEPGPTVRWPLGMESFGQLKTEVIKNFIETQYPKTIVTPFDYKIGSVVTAAERAGGKLSEQQVLDEFFNGISLLLDASAELGVSHFLSYEAKKRNIPYVCIYATEGAWGGLMMRVVPGKTEGCWMCLQYAKRDYPDDFIPVMDGEGKVQAAGCGDITFTGASFDLQNVTLAGVRMAVSVLCSDEENGYPDLGWDVGVLKLMEPGTGPTPPQWEVSPLKIHPECPYCHE
jgi:molybdopterin/thiamine biosynthesis adenylyltransferase